MLQEEQIYQKQKLKRKPKYKTHIQISTDFSFVQKWNNNIDLDFQMCMYFVFPAEQLTGETGILLWINIYMCLFVCFFLFLNNNFLCFHIIQINHLYVIWCECRKIFIANCWTLTHKVFICVRKYNTFLSVNPTWNRSVANIWLEFKWCMQFFICFIFFIFFCFVHIHIYQPPIQKHILTINLNNLSL